MWTVFTVDENNESSQPPKLDHYDTLDTAYCVDSIYWKLSILLSVYTGNSVDYS
jgi:hypothetical protein